MKILMLNGPPESGKDVIADLIVQKINDSGIKSEKKMVKSLLIKTAIKMSGVTVDEWDRHYERDLKEVPWYKRIAVDFSPLLSIQDITVPFFISKSPPTYYLYDII